MANNPLTDAALAELDRLHAAATPGEWQINGSHIYGPDPKRSLIAQTLDWPTNSRDAIAALHNAYPALRQRLLDAESRLAEVERDRDQSRALADAARAGMRQLGEDLEASRAEVERLRAVVNDMGDLMADVRKQRDTATARAEAAEKEALEYIDYRNQAVISRNAMECRLEAAESLVAGLRGALEEVDEVLCVTKAHDIGDAVVKAFSIINAALALTPASAGARLKAEATRKCAAVLRDDLIAAAGEVQGKEFINAIYAASGWLEQMADGIEAEAEKEAANGK